MSPRAVVVSCCVCDVRVKDLLMGMLRVDPKKRLTAEEVHSLGRPRLVLYSLTFRR